jgi:phage gp36-like protein
MAYSALEQIQQRVNETTLIRLTTDSGDAVDLVTVEGAIADADAEIDGYVGRRHAVPLDPVPPMLVKLSADIAVRNLYGLRPGSVPEEVKDRYKDAVRFLKDVSSGVVSLGVDDPEGTPSATHKTDIESSDRVFSRTKLEGF